MLLNKKEIITEVHRFIHETWNHQELKTFFLGPYKDPDFLNFYHHNLGQYIRNKYRLWEMVWTPEIIDGVDFSTAHPDDMSMAIIRAVWKIGPLNHA